jgi:F-type H+-transporting ATPase subunit alpha
VATLWTVQNELLDDVPVEKVQDFQAKLSDFLTTRKVDLLDQIRTKGALDDELNAGLKAAVTEFKQTYQ